MLALRDPGLLRGLVSRAIADSRPRNLRLLARCRVKVGAPLLILIQRLLPRVALSLAGGGVVVRALVVEVPVLLGIVVASSHLRATRLFER